MPLVRLLILPDPANVFAPSDNAILLPLLLPEAPIGILPTTSPPARSTAEVDMSAFDENMDPSSSSLSSSLKRDRDSPAEVKPVGTKVRILPLRMRVFLLFSMGVLEAFFYRGVRKMQISLPFASRSICFFGAWRWGGRRPVFCACTDTEIGVYYIGSSAHNYNLDLIFAARAPPDPTRPGKCLRSLR